MRAQCVRLQRTGVVDVKNFVPVRGQPIGNQHAMTTRVVAFGAHARCERVLRERDEFRHRLPELPCEHVVGVVAKGFAPESHVRRVVKNLLSVAAECLHPHVLNTDCRDAPFQIVTVELRQATRHGEGANINQRLDLMRLQRSKQFVQGTRRMPDGVKSGQPVFDAGRLAGDAAKGGDDCCVLLGEDRTQIDEHVAFVYAADDWRVSLAKTCADIVGTHPIAGYRSELRGQNG